MSDDSAVGGARADEDPTPTGRASAGEARRITPALRGALANAPDRLTPEQLALRQERISTRRKPAGPELRTESVRGPSAAAEEAPSQPSDVPPTECADPPETVD
jgi:hypothetical protein